MIVGPANLCAAILANSKAALPPTPPEIAEKIREAAARIKPAEASFRASMHHVLWAGMYARTCLVPGGCPFTSVLIKIPTLLVVFGECFVFAGDRWRHLKGYNVIPAQAGRIQAYFTVSATAITMLFPTQARTVEEAEAEFTDEADELLSRRRPEDNLDTTFEVKA